MAGSGAEALDRLRTSEYDLVLMDVEMPGMDGLEATRRIRDGDGQGLPARIPIVIASAFVQPDDQERCRSAGVDGYVSKPMEPRRLLDLLRDVLDARSS